MGVMSGVLLAHNHRGAGSVICRYQNAICYEYHTKRLNFNQRTMDFFSLPEQDEIVFMKRHVQTRGSYYRGSSKGYHLLKHLEIGDI